MDAHETNLPQNNGELAEEKKTAEAAGESKIGRASCRERVYVLV